MNKLNCRHEIREKVCVNCRSIVMASWFEEMGFPIEMRNIFFKSLKHNILESTENECCVLCSSTYPIICKECFFDSSNEILNNLVKNELRNSPFELMFRSEPFLVTQKRTK